MSFFRSQNVLIWSNFFVPDQKNYLHIVSVKNIWYQTKRWCAHSKIVFCTGTNIFEEALNAVKFLGWVKKFGPAQKILGPVKGHGIKVQDTDIWKKSQQSVKYNSILNMWAAKKGYFLGWKLKLLIRFQILMVKYLFLLSQNVYHKYIYWYLTDSFKQLTYLQPICKQNFIKHHYEKKYSN